jgi:hypothetical protein
MKTENTKEENETAFTEALQSFYDYWKKNHPPLEDIHR